MAMPLTIHLELSELATIETVKQHAASGLIGRGDPISADANRAAKIVEIVRSLFLPLGEAVTIRLGDGTGSDRFLKADFAWNGDPDIGGVSAQGLGRTKLGKFNRRAVDQNRPVTGYIFEGAIGGWIVDLLGATVIRANNVFATFIAHELGHQLGLGHEAAKDNIMFVWADMPVADRQQYLRLANDVKLAFTEKQVAAMKATIAAP
ncbi:matrixin family metalloprotease [Elioraea rosea]|uniref:matrixin family metalloprotease n=1 Tax=Elioraea rosea TaxID=2492390 RepID=UPI00118546BA|nr:matrixin family metalloprotease [Elioraea rosea]